MNGRSNRLHPSAYLGLAMILCMELMLALQSRSGIIVEIARWTTPICWWGYILLIDAVVFRLKGESLIRTRTREFLVQLPVSMLFWLLFEVYNLHLQNWRYIGLPENALICWTGRTIAYASIMPALLETAELFETLGIFRRLRIAPLGVTNRKIYVSILVGFVFVVVPLLVSRNIARYLFAFVWMGFIFIIDPVVYCSGGRAFLSDLQGGKLERIVSLFVGGYVCGFLWEFWNYWSPAKWIYTVPFTRDIHIFEMPLAGFLGFGPFAWENYAMFALIMTMLGWGESAQPEG